MYKKNAWEKYTKDEMTLCMQFSECYKDYLTASKTEREMVISSVNLAKKYGYKDIKEFKTLKAGDKVYATNKGKNFAAFIIGKEPITKGLNILGAHIDSPRLDIKQNPIYEDNDICYLDTHYYGGIIKYQWVTRPMALHGVICKKDGSLEVVNIGEDENDPVFCISDLLIHLSADKLTKTAAKAVEGEDLDLIIGGGITFKEDDKATVKANILRILKEKYGALEEDFISAELEVVPAGKTRDLGLDRSMVLGYGQDDKVCSYTSLMALLDSNDLERTSSVYLVDKEEVGSIGATGAESKWYFNLVARMISMQEGNYNDLKLIDCLENTYMLSSDVSAGYDPLYKGVFESKNASYLGQGLTFNKYTGARGKSGCNDAMPEFMAKIRRIMDDNNIAYQTAELGRVDVGGGGTIAYIMGNYNMNVIDAGVPVLSMHAPSEITSKADIYEAYLGYKAFIKEIK
jgi:aspartyl aminopeptidase